MGSRQSRHQRGLRYQFKEEAAEVKRYIEEFLHFLQHIEKLSITGWQLYRSDQQIPVRYFQRENAFYSLLSPSPDELSNPEGISVKRSTRLSCLLLLCHALIRLNAPSTRCNEYMSQQGDIILRERADRNSALRVFLQRLLKDPYTLRLRDLDCAYGAARSAQVIKRLSWYSQELVDTILLSCLAMDRVGQEGPLLTSADVERIRQEAFYFQLPGSLEPAV